MSVDSRPAVVPANVLCVSPNNRYQQGLDAMFSKAAPRGGPIDLALSTSGGDAVIVVRDGGVGIAAERLPHVFDPFSRQANDRSSRQAGLGLGLALAHRIVTLHHGDVTASSQGLGCGSEFTVHVPLWSAPLPTA